jgi:hypothetical protein
VIAPEVAPQDVSSRRRVRLFVVVATTCLLVSCGGATAPAREDRPDWTAPPVGATVRVPARVTFDAMQLRIENADSRPWADVLVEVRRARAPRVYRYRTEVITANRTLPMGALNFEAEDGGRMSPFEGPPVEWRIQVTLPDGTRAWATGPIVEVPPP